MFISEDKEGLTDQKILELSEHFTNKQDLRDVAIKGLKIAGKTVSKHIQNNSNNINDAAYTLFQEWRNTQENVNIAYDKMRQALEKAQKPYFKKALKPN